jgi:hypothetical protein
MRIAIDPVPLVIGIYVYVGEVLADAAGRREEADAETLGRRYGRRPHGDADRDLQKLVRVLQGGVKTADKLLKKSEDVWKISRETDLVNLVVHRRGEAPEPRAYVLLRPDETRNLLETIARAAVGAGADDDVVSAINDGAASVSGKPSEYFTFGFDPF